MRIASIPTLLLATVLAGPALWHAFAVGDLEPKTALLRYLLAVPLAAIMLALLRSITKSYRSEQPPPPLRVEALTGEPIPRRRTVDTTQQEQ